MAYVWQDYLSGAHEYVTIWEARAGTPKQQTVRGFGAVASWHRPAPTPYLLNKDYINYWSEKPIVKIFMFNVQYKLDEVDRQKSPVTMSPTEVVNSSKNKQSISTSISYTTSSTSTFTFSQAFEVGVAVVVSAGIPKFAGSTTTVSVSETTSFKYGNSTTESKTLSTVATMEIDPFSRQTVFITGFKYKSDVPYTADVTKTYFDGTTAKGKISGVYKNLDVSGFTITYGPVEKI